MLDPNGRVVLFGVQFAFASEEAIPQPMHSVGWHKEEDKAQREKRNSRSLSGVELIPPTLGCSLSSLPNDVGENWKMVEGFVQPRLNPDSDRRKRSYIARFTFAPLTAEVDDYFAGVAEQCSAGLNELCQKSLWRAQVHSNPFYQQGEVVDGVRQVMISMAVRQPLWLPDGSPVVARLKDERGEPIGEPVPITPDFHLRIVSSTIRLVPA